MRKTIWAGLLAALAILALSPAGDRFYLAVRPADTMPSGWQDYRALAFERAQSRGEPVLVEVYASWCPICRAQHDAFEALSTAGAVPPMRAFRVNYDRDKDFLHQFGVAKTGTLLLFHKGAEVARATSLTSPEAIDRFLERHLSNENAQQLAPEDGSEA
ncbi:thioredoxin family protein [Rhodothalassium salexigens]|uniref:thioredoxin family protein n=1 Tax=Rhodothalassium salexigens TaxID=1086 RepID=UPI001911B3DD|nr:thioredoxin family protein [Rhodothalassium salexigens]